MKLLDDVEIHHADGQVILEQTKSALNQNPVSDLANGLWKTFANWTQGSTAGTIDPDKAAFQIYVSANLEGLRRSLDADQAVLGEADG